MHKPEVMGTEKNSRSQYEEETLEGTHPHLGVLYVKSAIA